MTDGTVKLLQANDRIDKKLAENSLKEGIPVSGFLMFAFPESTKESLDLPINKIRIVFSDFYGTPSSITRQIGTTEGYPTGTSPYLPGLSVEQENKSRSKTKRP